MHWECAVGERYWLTTRHTKIIAWDLIRPKVIHAARSSHSFKTTQVARWLPQTFNRAILSLNMFGEPWRKNVLFPVFKHYACRSSYFQPNNLYISEIDNQYSIYWAYKRFIFSKFKNRAGMPIKCHPASREFRWDKSQPVQVKNHPVESHPV